MKRLLSVLVILVLLAIPDLFAETHTSKITIKGADQRLVEITDSKTLANFFQWAVTEQAVRLALRRVQIVYR